MAGISGFFTQKQQGSESSATLKTRYDKFSDKISDCKNKSEERDLESAMLVPEKLMPYTGSQPTAIGAREYAITFFMPGKEAFELVKKHFHVSVYVEKCVSNPALLLDLLSKIDSGEIGYDKKTRELKFDRIVAEGRDRQGSPEVDTREQRTRNRSRS